MDCCCFGGGCSEVEDFVPESGCKKEWEENKGEAQHLVVHVVYDVSFGLHRLLCSSMKYEQYAQIL